MAEYSQRVTADNDGRWYAHTGVWQPGESSISVANHRFLTRFTDLDIANGAEILQATYTVTAYGTSTSTPTAVTWVDWDDAPPVATDVPDPDVDVIVDETDLVAGTTRSYDVTDIIQHLVNRPGWVAGNAVVLMMRRSGSGSLQFRADGHADAALLEIEYSSTGYLDPTPLVQPVVLPAPEVAASGGASLSPTVLEQPIVLPAPDMGQAVVVTPTTIAQPIVLPSPTICIGDGWGTVYDPGVVAASEAYAEAIETHPETISNDLYRSIDGGPWVQIATGLPPDANYIDGTNAVAGENCYYAVAWTSMPSAASSEVECLTIYDGTLPCPPGEETTVSAWVSGGENFGVRCRALIDLVIEEADLGVVDRVLHKFSGRTYPSEFSGLTLGQSVTITFSLPRTDRLPSGERVATREEWAALARMKGPHLYRDYQGRRFVCSLSPLSGSDIGLGLRTMTLTVTRTEEDV